MSVWSFLKQEVAAVSVVVVCLALSTDAAGELFIYRRGDLLAGEYWRLVSGHFVHVTTAHLLLNLAAWLLIWVYGRAVCTNLTWVVLVSVCAAGTGVGLLWFSPEVMWYTGLSGVLHGLFIAIAVLRLLAYRGDYAAWFVLVIIAIKLAYEYSQGATPITASWVGLQVIPEAHLYGAISGILVAAVGLIRVCRKRFAIA